MHKIAADSDQSKIVYYLQILGSQKVMDKLVSDSGGGSVVDCDAAGQTLRDPAKIIEICHKVPPDQYSNCITGALNVIVEFWAEKMENKPHQLCKLIPLQNEKKNCYSHLASRLNGIYGQGSQKISQSCSFFEPSFRPLCLNL